LDAFPAFHSPGYSGTISLKEIVQVVQRALEDMQISQRRWGRIYIYIIHIVSLTMVNNYITWFLINH